MLIVKVSFLIALPIIRLIASFIGLWRHSKAERVARNVLLFLLVFNILLVYTISGTIFFNLDFFLNSSLTKVRTRPSSHAAPAIAALHTDLPLRRQIVDLLAQTIPQQAYNFTSYVMTKGLLGCSLLLLRPHFCFAWWFLRYVLAQSPAQRREADRPFIFEFDESYARAALAAIITLTYSTMFPVILMCVASLCVRSVCSMVGLRSAHRSSALASSTFSCFTSSSATMRSTSTCRAMRASAGSSRALGSPPFFNF